MDIGQAIKALKEGNRVARAGWNGKGMWLVYSPGKESLHHSKLWSAANAAWARQQPDSSVKILPCITMKTATGEILMGWLASQTDLLAEDWEIVK